MNKTLKTIGYTTLTLLTIPAIIALIPGYEFGIGTGNSMQPNMTNPSLHILETNPDNIQEGDIIGDGKILHRAHHIQKTANETKITRKGDNNDYYDQPIKKEDVKNRVILKIPTPWWKK